MSIYQVCTVYHLLVVTLHAGCLIDLYLAFTMKMYVLNYTVLTLHLNGMLSLKTVLKMYFTFLIQFYQCIFMCIWRCAFQLVGDILQGRIPTCPCSI